ncbi:hypothetical protein [Tautonia plasticadhaerens]|uniref:Response regulatory domain-containing protein n=1 Tax=Tautonia plasticadhaerens TaxID=2527974 RepID=A0A518H6W3_9BACT|nr:hypothetical protein [Tautonia plasticadhaerens]QDV36575.1 hypothetical protein ElP_45030 [Tautonia plasticadhaerens]
MDRQLVVIHERRGSWAAQLRGRLHHRPVRWRETRGTEGLLDALGGSPCPILVLDVGPRAAEGLDRLVRASARAPSALILALDPEDRPEVRHLARPAGASMLWSGFAPPPDVAALVDRWIDVARLRASRAGRAALPGYEPDPSDDPLALLGP